MKGQNVTSCKRIVAIMLVIVMTLSMVFTFAGCSAGADGKDGITPKLRINEQTNFWEVSYDEGETWESLGVKATGEDGKDGKDGKDGIDGINGINGINGADGKDGINGINGTNGKDGVDGQDGKDGIDGEDGKDGIDGINGVDGEDGKDATLEDILSIIEDYETFKTVAPLIKNTSFGSASCFGTNACFGSCRIRVLTDDHGYYNGAAGIANYLKGVFVEDENGNVSINMSSSIGRISYTDALTLINFASAFSSYNEYIIRNNLTMPADIASQKELAIKYFNTVDYKAEGYHKHTGGGGLSFPSLAVGVVALGSLMEQSDTARFDTLIKDAYENVDEGFWDANKYLEPMYQLCVKYSWFDKTKLPKVETLTNSNILNYYAYGINVAKEYPELWNTWVKSALADNAINAAEAKAFAYHYAYQLTGGDIELGIYGSSRAIVDFSKYQ